MTEKIHACVFLFWAVSPYDNDNDNNDACNDNTNDKDEHYNSINDKHEYNVNLINDNHSDNNFYVM